ncbi:MAG: Fe3+-citrate ABC transporter substrate-binding protein, partial [Firmicutes bacterium]|nr:Fe3+-citrate ABC transporter substrate-binding protein [Bacillota bacterium]
LMLITNFTTATPDDIYNNTVGVYDWSGVSAVADKKVYKMPLGMYRSYTPGVDTPMTLLWLAQTVYPDLFSDIDLTAEVKDYYQNVFSVELTDEQVASIFAPPADAGSGF